MLRGQFEGKKDDPSKVILNNSSDTNLLKL
jgi:hypothetical protein